LHGALQGRERQNKARTLRRGFVLALLIACSGCATGTPIGSAGLDRETLTGSVPPPADDRLSDEMTIRNAVSSADLAALGAKPLAWANRDTGAAGTIDAVVEFKDGGTVCRRFKAVVENYEGVRLHSGTACLVDGSWRMTKFEAV
jgi:hypothetical protein